MKINEKTKKLLLSDSVQDNLIGLYLLDNLQLTDNQIVKLIHREEVNFVDKLVAAYFILKKSEQEIIHFFTKFAKGQRIDRGLKALQTRKDNCDLRPIVYISNNNIILYVSPLSIVVVNMRYSSRLKHIEI